MEQFWNWSLNIGVYKFHWDLIELMFFVEQKQRKPELLIHDYAPFNYALSLDSVNENPIICVSCLLEGWYE